MTVLPFLDIKATPVRSLESPRISRAQSLRQLSEEENRPTVPNAPQQSSRRFSKISSASIRTSVPSSRIKTPKIQIVARSDEILRKLPHAKSLAAENHHSLWKPLGRDPVDYDYLWEPVHREDMRHQYDDYVPPQRIIASRPDEPYKMSTMFETQDRHYHNYKRVQAMQQRQWNREHMQYTVFPYSHAEERENYNKQIRSTLKEQMEQKIQTEKNELEAENRIKEMVMEQDRQDIEGEKQRQIQRARLLQKVTVKNKELMENKWNYDQWNRLHQWHVERAILADNPINWSKTMT